uniref:DUF4283 domain-containing protein n=1 Tax=Arundo donax TaxID=35708 RepID=A0A0A8Y133_ARUDO
MNAVGNIWCPRWGIHCRDLGDNLFLFTFLQPAGKHRAIENGPWEFGGDLLIVRSSTRIVCWRSWSFCSC